MARDWSVSERKRRESASAFWRRYLSATMSALLAAASFTTLIVWTQTQKKASAKDAGLRVYESEFVLSKVEQEVQQLQAEQRLMRANVAQLKDTASHVEAAKDGRAAERLAAVGISLRSLQQRSETLANLLGDDPEKRMSLILLARDLNQEKASVDHDLANMREQAKADIALVRDESKSNFEFVKWALGLIAAANVIAPIISLLTHRRRSDKDHNGDVSPATPAKI